MQRVLSAPVHGERLSVTRERQNARFMREQRLIAGRGVRMSYGPNGILMEIDERARSSVGTSSSIRPWTVRWMPASDDDDTRGEWQIYAPTGSLSVNYKIGYETIRSYAAMCMNDAVKGADGKELFGWFKIPDPSESDAENINGETPGKLWTVRLFVKPWARYRVSSGDEMAYGRCAWTESVATIGVFEYTYDGVKSTHHTVSQILTEKITRVWDSGGAFAADYELTEPQKPTSGHKVSVISQSVMLGRLQRTIQSPSDITGKESVWLKIEHATERFDIKVVTEDPGDSNDDQTTVRILGLVDDVVTEDYRDGIGNLPFYTNPADKGNE